MDATGFRDCLAKADAIVAQRRRAIQALRQERRAEPDLLAEGLYANRPCPHYSHAEYRRWGQTHGLRRFRYAAFGRKPNALTGTPLVRLRHRERWGEYAQVLIDGDTARAAVCRCGVHENTAFRRRHRFLALPAEVKTFHLYDLMEADETYFLESRKGERHLPRPPRKSGRVVAKRGLSAEQILVLVVRDRSTTTTGAVLARATTAAMRAVLGPIGDPDAVVCSDSNAVYRSFAKATPIARTPVGASAREARRHGT